MKKLFLLLTAIFCFAAMVQARTVSGQIIDAQTGDPLVGATVLPLGGGTGVAADIDGNFTLTIPDNVKTLRISSVGYANKEVKVEDHPMIIKLESDNMLETVVVTGYGSAKKLGSVVGSVSVVGEDVFKDVPTATFLDALQGQVAGLNISSNSGDPSAGEMHIRMRGVNSLSTSSTPLFILDGAPITSAVFTTLNPSDIESVTVLKDAASVAIYGSRAANGVIVITSKKGKFGEKARVNLRASYGWSQMTSDKVDMMSSEEYIRYRDLINKPVPGEVRSLVENYGINTNWRDEVFNSHAPTYQLDASVTGGSDNSSYYISLNHYDADGIMCQSHLRRSTLRVNVSTRVTDWFRVGFKSNLGYEKAEKNSQNETAYDGGGTAYTSNPSMFARQAFPYDSPRYYTFDNKGNIVYGERASYIRYSDLVIPEALLSNRDQARKNLTINATLDETIIPVKGLTLRAQQNVDAFDYRYSSYAYPRKAEITPMGDINDWYDNLTGWNSQSFQRYYAFTYTNTAEYTTTIADLHNLTVLIGQEAIVSKSESFGAQGDDYTDARTMFLQNSQSKKSPKDMMSQSMTRSVFNSFFGTLSYDYNSRYFFDATFRRDGSSRFAPKHQWANFFSLGGMWRISDEAWLRDKTWINDLTLRLSYGTTGNANISQWLYNGSLAAGNPYSGGLSGLDAVSIGIASASNYELTWETVRAWDLGVGFAFLDNKIRGEVDFYRKETVDMLMTIPYSYTTGFASGFGNIGNMTNTGVDIDLNFDVIKTRDWYWGLRANFNYNHNEITKLFDGQDTFTLPNTGVQYKVGHSAGEMYTVAYAGVDPRDGQMMWWDKDGNLTKVFNEERDAKLIGKSQYAPYSGGFGTDLRWKGLSLRADFNWATKKYMINNDRYFIENNNFGDQSNQMTSMLNVWTYPGQVTDIPAADGQTLQFDSHLIENASYLRLKTLTLAYQLPQSVLNKIKLNNVTFHVTGRNLLTFTGYTGYDPEPESNVVAFFYPNTRQYEVGVEVSF